MSRAGGVPGRTSRFDHARLDELLDALPDAIGVTDGEGGLAFANAAMRELHRAFGADVLAPTSPGHSAGDYLELGNGKRRFATRVSPFGADGANVIVLRETSGDEDTERLHDELFGLVSHELRTPLASIIGYLDLAREGTKGEQRSYLDVVDRNARRLLRLVDDLLFSAQVEAGQIPLTESEFDLVEPVHDAVEAARPRARARGIQLELAVDRSTLCLGDRDRVTQVVDNLIANALKFTPPGGSVSVRLTTAESDAIVEIADSGPGIAHAEQAKLFERFYRSPDAVDEGVPGTGLGLSIVKSIVEAHGGRIGVRGNQSGGATFVLALPARGAVRQETQLASGRPPSDRSDSPTPCDPATRRGR
jgi:signal transduction histidine kinase